MHRCNLNTLHLNTSIYAFIYSFIYSFVHSFTFTSDDATVTDFELDYREAFLPRPLKPSTSALNLSLYSKEVMKEGGDPEIFSDIASATSLQRLSSMDSTDGRARSGTQQSVGSYCSSSDLESLFHIGIPTWEPLTEFNFPIEEMASKYTMVNDLSLSIFSEVEHIADGSNSNVYKAKFNNEKVIVKMIKSSMQEDPIAIHEFDIEHGMLARIEHKNIIKVLGAGRVPRRFIVLEFLGGGSLFQLLDKNNTKPSLTQRIFRKPTFTYVALLERAKELASALDYLHNKIHVGSCIIHRDLKPDNVGFTDDGTLKLFDFGLATCVRQRTSPTQSYMMTGNTGSLRYMAPEVTLKLPYSEKVDVYSFGIMLWQMARDRVPFKGYNKRQYVTSVVQGLERPKIDRSWPSGFSSLLTRCWNAEATARPSFGEILFDLEQLSQLNSPQTTNSKNPPTKPSSPMGTLTPWGQRGKPVQAKKSDKGTESFADAHSSWF